MSLTESEQVAHLEEQMGRLEARLRSYTESFFDLEWEYNLAIKALEGAKVAIQQMAELLTPEDDFYQADLARVIMALESNESWKAEKYS